MEGETGKFFSGMSISTSIRTGEYLTKRKILIMPLIQTDEKIAWQLNPWVTLHSRLNRCPEFKRVFKATLQIPRKITSTQDLSPSSNYKVIWAILKTSLSGMTPPPVSLSQSESTGTFFFGMCEPDRINQWLEHCKLISMISIRLIGAKLIHTI